MKKSNINTTIITMLKKISAISKVFWTWTRFYVLLLEYKYGFTYKNHKDVTSMYAQVSWNKGTILSWI